MLTEHTSRLEGSLPRGGCVFGMRAIFTVRSAVCGREKMDTAEMTSNSGRVLLPPPMCLELAWVSSGIQSVAPGLEAEQIRLRSRSA
ncbi:hypothetical protein NDU88_000660 [Pleurodeles waltl]|uniref:Uncharacterized protein n=1 Tax=Pleurodeles waltl TaxID=8319 RepID=A0AAV7UQL4_PLEWA|nr:hypothetical protein NDU88_000660 [Pleurodeles waltl]